MASSRYRSAVAGSLLALAALAFQVVPALAQHDKLRIQVGKGDVVTMTEDVRTVAIAEPKIADAAVGSARTVVVNGKAPGVTSLVVYTEGGRFKVYDVEVYQPNADRQVLLRVQVAEINDNARKELGFDFAGWGSSNTPWLDGFIEGGLFTTKVATPSIPLGIGPNTDGALHYSRNDGRFTAQTTWRALEEKGDIRTLANPTLVAQNGQKASFLAGGEFPVPVATGSGAVSPTGVTTTTVTIEWREFGVKVEFTPTLLDERKIQLQVAPEVSQLDFSNPLVLSGFSIPILVSRKASTTVTLGPGEFLVIGGLKHKETVKTVRRIPILGQIPLLGFFFRNTVNESVDRELLVVVSPELVEAVTNAPALPTDRPQRR